MRIHTVSDIHIDYPENRRWLNNLSTMDFTDDILILGGDVTDLVPLLIEAFQGLRKRFREVVFCPGNHDLWVSRNKGRDSLEQFRFVQRCAADHGLRTGPFRHATLTIIPLLGWYDYSFGPPSPEIRHLWVDFQACRWPEDMDETALTTLFTSMNEAHLTLRDTTVISFSHFLPRIDLMPAIIPPAKRLVYPVLGTTRLEDQIRRLAPRIHVYGHSHVNMRTEKDGITYINNAFGYPDEQRITAKRLVCIHEI